VEAAGAGGLVREQPERTEIPSINNQAPGKHQAPNLESEAGIVRIDG